MRKIVVVEDNPDNRLLVFTLLEGRYDIVEYDNGAEALAGLPAEAADLVLLDISLPGMDGGDVLKEIRKDPALAATPVVALTAHAMAGDRDKYIGLGFDGYVAKPIVDETVLFSVIEGLLDGDDS